ncbi:MAG: hypothetical protein AAF985_08590 [Bacteroidota bacterium]
MKHSFPFPFLFIGLLLCIWSCDKQNIAEVPQDTSPEYFPLAVGKFMIYEVDSVIYDIDLIDTVHLFVKEEIVDTFIDNANRTNYRIERSERATESDPWQIKDVWVALQNGTTAERVEENFRFVKMVFPLSEGTSWDGNQFVDKDYILTIEGETLEIFKGWSSEVETVGLEETVNGMSFGEVTTIAHARNENLIELRESVEKYARNVGLIEKKIRILDTQCIVECEGQPWEEKAEKGFILQQRILSFN